MIRSYKEKTIEKIKDECNFDDTKDAFDEEKIPPQREFFFGGGKENFVHACNFLSLKEDN